MPDKFVAISKARSGSNLLVSLLDGHPQIACFGELLRRTPDWMRREGYRGALRILERTAPVFRDDRHRFAHPAAFVRAAFATRSQEARARGFKLQLGQHPDFLVRLVKDPEWKLLVLERANKLAVFSSGQIARQTGQGNARVGQAVERARVRFCADAFERFLRNDAAKWKRARTLVRKSGKEVLSLGYTALAREDTQERLFSFLGVDPTVRVRPRTQKRNPSAILERFSNPGEVRAFVEARGQTAWLEEPWPVEAR